MKRREDPRRIIFRNQQAPGDVLMMTAAIRDLHRAYPGKFITGISGSAADVWANNPYVTKLDSRKATTITLGYPLIAQSNQSGLHFIQGFIDDVNKKLNLKVRLTEFRPDVHWTEEELSKPLVDGGGYWVLLSGGKADFTTKWWDPARHQQVVDKLGERGIRFVQLGNKPDGGGARHYHPSLRNVVNLVGKTSLREAFRVILHARGLITPITCFMHLAAACAKPTVVVAGGREHYTWEAYNGETLRRNMAFASGMIAKPPGRKEEWMRWSPEADRHFVPHPFVEHKYLHTIGSLNCCMTAGCWKSKVTEGKKEHNCRDVVRRPGRPPLPKCMDMITVEKVVESVLEYEQGITNGASLPVLSGSASMPLIVNVPNADAAPLEQPASPVVDAALDPKPVARYSRPSGKGYIPSSRLNFDCLKFPITVFGLTYGNHADLAMRCLQSLYAHWDPACFRLRYAMNEPSINAEAQIRAYLEDKPNVEKLYIASPQLYKYPMMREMFRDPELPITTDWVMWLDDDSHIADRGWIDELGKFVDEKHLEKTEAAPRGYHCFGKVYYFHLLGASRPGNRLLEWIESASWYGQRPYPVDRSKNPPLAKSDFCTGGWWLVTREAIQACDWPDRRLIHRGGDIMFGAALHQQGYGVVQVAGATKAGKRKKWFEGVKISDAVHRGYNEPIAGVR